jgi:YD repeat-containing protein
MHAPVSIVRRPTNPLDAAKIMRGLHPLRPHIRHGTREIVTMPQRSELDPRHRRLDPLAMRRSTTKPKADVLQPLAMFLPPARSGSVSQQPRGALAVGPHKAGGGVKHLFTPGNPTTGIEHWWTYEERAIPGIGKAMLNVGTGNLVVAAMDVDVHEQGIDLAFQRVYNLQSLHDYNGDDGGDSAIFGNRWTNNFDANIIYNSDGTMTVYDIDGTGCVYTPSGGSWVPCTGEYATLAPTDGSDCTYAWTKTNGTVYWFHSDQTGSGCGIQLAKKGHLQEIIARNNVNSISFAYSYAGSGHGAEDVSEIDANHSDGHSLVMKFGPIPGTNINELATITMPDGHAELQYSYDTSGNLLEVDKPGNNSATSVPSGHGVPQGDAPETYAYATGTSSLQEACGPRCTVAMWNNPSSPTDGSALLFTVSSLQLTKWQVDGVLNFTPSDGLSEPLHPGQTITWQNWYTAYFVYGATQEDGCIGTSGTTTMCDTDGHGTTWTTDSSYRVTQTSDYTGTAEGLSIVTSQGWDTNNDLISTTDANGNETQYGYDVGGYNQGNMVEMQLPQAADITNGPLSPLSYYSYDSNNNVTAYCDPVWTSSNSKNWVSSPGDSLCTGSGGFATFTFNSGDSNEPFGCLTAMQKPGGYATTISYWHGTGTCGVGLPATVQGASITQYDQSTRRPIQDFAYDGYGNLSTYDKGMGTQGLQDSWTLAYDPDNSLTQRTNNDATITNAVITSMSCYYLDGSLFYTETPSQWANDDNKSCPSISTLLAGSASPASHATAYYYDTDGDQVEAITHKGCSTSIHCNGPTSMTACASGQSNAPGTTCKYYDGLDRLVETAQPYDTRTFPSPGSQPYEFYGFRWMNRYIYDLSQEGGSANLSISDSTRTISNLVAYGGLYKTQECLPPESAGKQLNYNSGPYNSCTFLDVRGNSFDGLGRTIAKYELAYGTTPVTLNTYDYTTGQYDLLYQTVNAVGQKTTYAYDNIARVKQVSFSGTSPSADGRQYTFDADGRTASIQDTTGFGTLSYTYDVDGNKLSVTEPGLEGAASVICYSYYLDGLREYVSIGDENKDSCGSITSQNLPSNGGIRQNQIFSYAYRQHDGLLTSQKVSWNENTENFAWVYTPSERETTETDPLNTAVVQTPPDWTTTTLGQKSYQYDSYGRVSQLIMPEGFEESTFVYDGDDELVSYSASNGGQGGITRNLTLDARGEILADVGQAPTYSANGTQVGKGSSQIGNAYNQEAPNGEQFDVRSGMITAITNPYWAQDSGQLKGAGAYVYSYDQAGRQTAATQYPNWPTGGNTAGAYSYTYDAENHVQAYHVAGDGTPATVQWGPDGRQRVDTFGTNNNETAHWDGDEMLFSTTTGPNSGTTGAYLYIGKQGIMDSSGDIYVADWDQTGEQQASHGWVGSAYGNSHVGNWYSSWAAGTARNVALAKLNTSKQISFQINGSCNFTAQNSQYYSCPIFFPTFAMLRADGYQMIGGLVQGARTFDMTSNQWLTPDAYAGDVHDPASQKPFMYNNNNPVEWSDPSGYEGCVPGTCGIDAINPPKVPTNVDVYVKGEVSGGVGVASGSLSITVSSAPAVYVSGGGHFGFSGTPGKLGGGYSVTAGIITAYPHHTTSQVQTKGSTGLSGGFVVGGEYNHNDAGYVVGGGYFSSPQAGFTGSYGFQLLGGRGAGDSSKSPQRGPQKPAHKPN